MTIPYGFIAGVSNSRSTCKTGSSLHATRSMCQSQGPAQGTLAPQGEKKVNPGLCMQSAPQTPCAVCSAGSSLHAAGCALPMLAPGVCDQQAAEPMHAAQRMQGWISIPSTPWNPELQCRAGQHTPARGLTVHTALGASMGCVLIATCGLDPVLYQAQGSRSSAACSALDQTPCPACSLCTACNVPDPG